LPSWDANLYLRFAGERIQPAIDLISRIALSDPKRIVDLGCGPGNSTAMLRERWPAAEVAGLDNSREMIVAAAQAHPDWTWIVHDITTWKAAAPFDLIFSNAALQWVPNHAELMPRLLMQVGSRGALAVQMPAHFQSPVHELLLEVAHNDAWRYEMRSAVQAIKVERPAFYYDLLRPHVSKLDFWETEYIHQMNSPAAILEWMRGTALRPFLEALSAADQKRRFERLFLSRLETAYAPQKDGRVLFPFRRLFLIAYR